jgi:exodeoxyribonuclease V alpha subunit
MALRDELIREKIPDQTLLCYQPTYFHTEQNLAQLISGRLSQPIAQDIPRVRNSVVMPLLKKLHQH